MIVEAGSIIESTRMARVQVTAAGFDGDRHAGLTRPANVRDKDVPRGTVLRNDRQVTIVSQEELAQVAAALDVPEVRPEWLGANLSLSGVTNLSGLPPGSRLVFSDGVVLGVEAQNQPCTGPGRVIQAAYPQHPGLAAAFPKAARGLRGLTASVRQPGSIATGDLCEVHPPDESAV